MSERKFGHSDMLWFALWLILAAVITRYGNIAWKTYIGWMPSIVSTVWNGVAYIIGMVLSALIIVAGMWLADRVRRFGRGGGDEGRG